MIPIQVRPLLVSGMLATGESGPVILIDSEQPEHDQAVALWHEVLHLLGLTAEREVEALARILAAGCPQILRCLAPVINVPSSTTNAAPQAPAVTGNASPLAQREQPPAVAAPLSAARETIDLERVKAWAYCLPRPFSPPGPSAKSHT